MNKNTLIQNIQKNTPALNSGESADNASNRQFFDSFAVRIKYTVATLALLSFFVAMESFSLNSFASSPSIKDNTVRGLATLTVTPPPVRQLQNNQTSQRIPANSKVVQGVFQAKQRTEAHDLPPTSTFPQIASSISLKQGDVSIITAQGSVPVARLRTGLARSLATPANPIHIDMFSPEVTALGDAPLLYGEIVDDSGRPLRWILGKSTYTDNVILECSTAGVYTADGIARLIRKVNLPKGLKNKVGSAQQYAHSVDVYAQKYSLPKALIFAIMHTESNFNPYAISRSNALGLMQVVPATAGEEVHNYLTGTRAIPSAQTLLTPEHNIRYGTTYIHLLTKNYFGSISNTTSRYLCTIAAYNGGPGAVLRVFDSNKTVALAKINALTSDEVYTILTTKMPSTESRRYVQVVLAHYHNYSGKDTVMAMQTPSTLMQ